MKFTEAVWFLQSNGVKVEPSSIKNNTVGRFYKVIRPTHSIPEVWCTYSGVCSIAKKLQKELTAVNLRNYCGF